jgi:GNAT superfamily N-acetyltransferase
MIGVVSMLFQKLVQTDMPQLMLLMQQYKKSICESELSEKQFEKLESAIMQNKIEFFVAKLDDKLVAMCSVGVVFSTYKCENIGIFEDFYVAEEYRGKGVARGLTQHVFDEMKAREIANVWVGCADVEMYRSLGFDINLGNLLTWNSDEKKFAQ